MSDLTEEQKKFISENYLQITDLNELTKRCFNDQSLDGRKKEGRLVRQFLIDNNYSFTTTKKEKSESIELNDAQKQFALLQSQAGTSTFRIAELIFQDREVKKLGMEQRAILDYNRLVNPDLVGNNRLVVLKYATVCYSYLR
jgi:hypothetical protein